MNEPLPVSRPPAPNWTPAVPNDPKSVGDRYGLQTRGAWLPGDVSRKQVIDSLLAVSLWRVSVSGPVLLDITYGTSAQRSLVDIEAPLVFTVPGMVQVYARPSDVDHEGVQCRVTLTPATAGGFSQCRKLATSPATLDDAAVRFTALVASTLTISGVVTVVPALSTVPLTAGALLTAGSGFQEFEA